MCVVLFYSNNYAVWCKDFLSENSIKCKMISVPRELSSDCGYCVKFDNSDLKVVEDLLSDSDIEFDRIAEL